MALLDDLANFDLFGAMVQPLLSKGWIIRNTDLKVTLEHPCHQWNHPWIFAKYPKNNCGMNFLTEKYLGFIPTECLGCWKVVVRPRTVKELFQLGKLQAEMGHPGKCGCDLRPHVHGLYGGYFYTYSKEEGLARYAEVQKAVDEAISPEVSVILKRYCTEFEIRHGPSDKYVQPEAAKIWEQLVDANFDKACTMAENPRQPAMVQQHIMSEWIQFAYQHGDPTALELNGGGHLYSQVKTYHEEE